nr:hypothetical protein [Klebsiella michiganensis]MDV1952222.1 hypothetical protein [Klebsiella michiganensis]
WLSEKLGRTPFSVAFQIAAIRELQDGWEEQFREISDKIRLSGLANSTPKCNTRQIKQPVVVHQTRSAV